MLEHDFYPILKRAYMHEKCDLQTVQLYFREQLDSLWWGQHHFPEGCLITEEGFENIVGVANQILSEKTVEPQLVKEFEYYVRLYQIYFAWQRDNRNGDFYELCKREGWRLKEFRWFIIKVKEDCPVLQFLCEFAGIEGEGAKEESIHRIEVFIFGR